MTKPSPSIDLLLHAEIAAAVADQLVDFLEGAFVEQQIDALAGGQFAFGVLAGAAFARRPLRRRRGGGAVLPGGRT